MKVNRPIFIPSVISLDSIISFDEQYGIASPEEPENYNEVASSEIFEKLKPGDERVCVMLRADGLTYSVIGEIMGKSESQIKNIIYKIRKRIIDGVEEE